MLKQEMLAQECCDTQTLRKFIDTNISGSYDISFQIADYERLYPLLAETEFPNKLIMNCWPGFQIHSPRTAFTTVLISS